MVEEAAKGSAAAVALPKTEVMLDEFDDEKGSEAGVEPDAGA